MDNVPAVEVAATAEWTSAQLAESAAINGMARCENIKFPFFFGLIKNTTVERKCDGISSRARLT